MGPIPQDVIDQVLAAHDVVEVVGRYVPLTRAGRAFKALCPFHEEKTPSFTVNPDRQSFKCFGCGKGGSVFGFLMEHDGLSFPEAVRMLARERGIKIPDSRERSPQAQGRIEAIRRALDFAQGFFVRSLAGPEGREARAYLQHRGYDADAVRRFGLGYAPPGWDRLLGAASEKRIGAPVLDAAGLAVAKQEGGFYDRFRHRVTFPVADPRGQVVSFGARALGDDDQPKYLNGPETEVFKKANTLYALDRAREPIRRAGEALLMEGYTDVLMCHLHGVERAVAGMGTAFTPRQAALLKRYARRVVLVYDADEAGRQAAERTLDILLPEGLEVRVALLPEGRDVDEILLEEGRPAFGVVLEDALGLLDFKLHALGRREDLSTPSGRARAGEALVGTILKVPSPVKRDQLLTAAGERLGGPAAEAAMRAEAARRLRDAGRLAAARALAPRPAAGVRPSFGGAGPSQAVRERTARDSEEFLLAGFAFFPALRPGIRRAVGPEDFADPVLRRIYNALLDLEEGGAPWDPRVLTGRLADDPEAQEVLAGLPEDATLEERVPYAIQFLERRRREERRAREIQQELAGDGSEDEGRGRNEQRGDDVGTSPADEASHAARFPGSEGGAWTPEQV